MIKLILSGVPVAAALLCLSMNVRGQDAPAAPKLKDEMRQPWQRGDESFVRTWMVTGPFACDLPTDCLKIPNGEGFAAPTDASMERKAGDGTTFKWKPQKSWGDYIAFDEISGNKDGVAYAMATVQRASAGKALLSMGSADGIRVWLNGKPVLSRDGHRSWTPDEDQVDVNLIAGYNTFIVKTQTSGAFSLRLLEPGAVVARVAEIGPSIIEQQPEIFTVRTDTSARNNTAEPVKVEVIRPGGAVVFTATAARGALVLVDAKGWPDGPYEARCSTRSFTGRLTVTHLAWYKGDALAKARELATEAARADATKPEGFTLKMLAEMVDDRLGVKLAEAKGNPWPKIHSPLMEYDELMLERAGKVGRVRPGGFVRLAWRDEVDGTPQYTRAYLPSNYDASRKWPLVIQIHGYNPANPVYWRWWSADGRHAGTDGDFAGNQQVIYMEPHGRGNVQYMGFGDSDILRGIAEAKRLFNVDEDRVYLTGDSMGGWGTWNVATRHPDLFAAIAPVFGGVDYHSQMSEEELAKLLPIDRFFSEKQSSWSMSEGLINMPIFVHHGDADQAVNVEWSRWGVKLLQRWGYDVRYREYPGKVHEALQANNGPMNIDWFLERRRDPNPRHVRIRSAELRNASAYWVSVQQSANPLDFMRVDAQIVDRNVIRLDTENVLDVVLTPSAALVDAASPVKVVWNGVAQDLKMRDGRLQFTSPDYRPASLHKTAKLPGSTADFFLTPYAVVIGTTAKDPDMAALCREKAQVFIDAWRDWQKFAPRVLLDTEITDADIARYSLILVGGPEANRVAARLAPKLPLRISKDGIRIDGKDFKVQDAAVQMLYPHPQNSSRYVWIVAGTSANGMYFTEPHPFRVYDWDYIIVDGHIPAFKQAATPTRTRVVSGSFDYNWHFADSLAYIGDAQIRANGRRLHRPDKNFRVDPKVLDSFVGRYQIEKGPLAEVLREGSRFFVRAGADESDLVPESETSYSATKYGVRIFFVRDAAGKVTGFTGFGGDGDFEGKKLD